MTTAIYAGSFDPFTNGHLNILEIGAGIFDNIIVLIANNPQKKYMLSVDTRLDLIKNSTRHLKNVKIDFFDGLTVEYAQKHGAKFLIRGLRTPSDFEYETQMAQINTKLSNDIKTVFIPATQENTYISSTMIRELLANKCDISSYVPDVVNQYLLTNYAERI